MVRTRKKEQHSLGFLEDSKHHIGKKSMGEALQGMGRHLVDVSLNE